MSPNETGLGQLLMMVGVILIVLGAVLWAGKMIGWPRLPGDFLIKRDNFTFYIPITTSILLSIIITIVIYLVKKYR